MVAAHCRLKACQTVAGGKSAAGGRRHRVLATQTMTTLNAAIFRGLLFVPVAALQHVDLPVPGGLIPLESNELWRYGSGPAWLVSHIFRGSWPRMPRNGRRELP